MQWLDKLHRHCLLDVKIRVELVNAVTVRETWSDNPVGHLDKVMLSKTMNANSDARTYRLSEARVEGINHAGCNVHTKTRREWPSCPIIRGC